MAKRLKEQTHFNMKKIYPLTPTQELVFQQYKQNKNLLLHGVAGTGKTFVSLYLALNEILNTKCYYDKVIILRSVVPSRDIGFLPGSIKEKTEVYEEPYKIICDELFQRGDGYDILRMKRLIEFSTTSFLRGMTFKNSILVVDEVQNMSYPELSTVITRLGDNCKIILSGDYKQSDFTRDHEKKGIIHFMNILKTMSEFSFIEFDYSDIVRSELVKNFIIAEGKYMENINVMS